MPAEQSFVREWRSQHHEQRDHNTRDEFHNQNTAKSRQVEVTKKKGRQP